MEVLEIFRVAAAALVVLVVVAAVAAEPVEAGKLGDSLTSIKKALENAWYVFSKAFLIECYFFNIFTILF